MLVLVSFFEYVLKHSTRSNGLKVLLAVSAYYVYKYRGHAIGARRRLDLKQPKGAVPLLGHLPLLASVPLDEFYEFLEKQYNEHGPVWSISLPGFGRMIQIDSPENFEHVVKTNFANYGKGKLFRDIVKDTSGYGIFASDGARWKFQRQLAVNIFNAEAFREYTRSVFVVVAKEVIGNLGKAADEGTVIDLQTLMLHFTMDTFGAVTFGESFGCLDDVNRKVQFAEAVDDVLEITVGRLQNPLWKITHRLDGTAKRAAYLNNLIRSYAQNHLDKRRQEGHHAKKNDFLQFLMEGRDDNDQLLSDELIIDNIVTFMIAARDTTAHALTWMFYLLLRDGSDPEVVDRVVRETDEVLGGEDPTYETHKKQKYTEACFNEALRVFPVVPRNLRICESDDILPDGTKVYAGEWVSWSSYVMNRSESIWGSDAKEYKPSRWLNTEKPSPSKFNTFHAGPRICVGQQFATIEALTVIGMIFQSFNLELEDPSRVPKYRPSLAFPMVGGLNVRVTRRFGGATL
ncbi:hypothetical protein BGZ80_008713 [Entomortierella chlamydospora]|uniref:Cytochrome P450 n=1 Tax=Entomortierella chlamydospora TaxID=101097 RepID=A0A9P6T1H8_9FUNG|nr:hypothetical protein BGZ80_008713 [Entomortierella chlamydospora]